MFRFLKMFLVFFILLLGMGVKLAWAASLDVQIVRFSVLPGTSDVVRVENGVSTYSLAPGHTAEVAGRLTYSGFYPSSSYTDSRDGLPSLPAMGWGAPGAGYIPPNTYPFRCTIQVLPPDGYVRNPGTYPCVVSFWPNYDSVSSQTSGEVTTWITARADFVPNGDDRHDCFDFGLTSNYGSISDSDPFRICIRNNNKSATLSTTPFNFYLTPGSNTAIGVISNTGDLNSGLIPDCFKPNWLTIANCSGTVVNSGSGQNSKTYNVTANTGASQLPRGDNITTIQMTATADSATGTATVTGSPQTVNIVYHVPLSCSPSSQTVTGASPASFSTNGPSTSNWNFGDGTTGSGTSVTHSYAAPGTYTATVTQGGESASCNVTVNPAVGSAAPPPGSSPPSNLTCTLSADRTTIGYGESVRWIILSSPSGLRYYWHVTGPTGNQTDTPGEGNGLTSWIGTYTYNTPGTYTVYAHVAQNGTHSACQTNTIILTVNPVSTSAAGQGSGAGAGTGGSGQGSGGLTCSASPSNDPSVPYQFSLFAGNRTPGSTTYSWSLHPSCRITSGNPSASSISIDCGATSGPYTAGVTENNTQRGAYCNYSACPAGGCPPDEPTPPDPGPLSAATDGYYEQVQCGTDEEGPVYCPILRGTWQDPLNGTVLPGRSFSGVDLKFTFRNSSRFNTDRVEFDCNNDGSLEATVPISYLTQSNDVPVFDLCSYSSVGTYTAVATAKQSYNGGICNQFPECVRESDTATINVTRGNSPPTIITIGGGGGGGGGAGGGGGGCGGGSGSGLPGVKVTEPIYCSSGPGAIVGWNYSDPDNDPQAYYQIQVDNNGSSFANPIFDSGKSAGNTCSYFAQSPGFQFNATYKARVKVWDNRGGVSEWVNQSMCSGPGCGGDGKSWKTPKHAYPQPNFTWSPLNPGVNQRAQFTDQTTFFDGGGVGQRTWAWNFGDNAAATSQNPTHAYSSTGTYAVNLTSTDKDSYSCSVSPSQNITVKSNIPGFKEVPPKP